jgi:hypothetical protein
MLYLERGELIWTWSKLESRVANPRRGQQQTLGADCTLLLVHLGLVFEPCLAYDSAAVLLEIESQLTRRAATAHRLDPP